MGCRMLRGLLAGLVVAVIVAAPAAAESGNGLYEPFPSSEQAPSAEAYYARLGLSTTIEQLDHGVFRGDLDRLLPAPAATDRGGIGGPALGAGALLGGLVAALAVVVAGALLRGRPKRSAGE